MSSPGRGPSRISFVSMLPGPPQIALLTREAGIRPWQFYIQSAELNEKVLSKPWFEHADIVNGGSLVLHMAARPNTTWGSAPEAAPLPMSAEQPAASN